MSNPYHHQTAGKEFEARAPYNFVPLPEKVFIAPDAQPDHGRYHADKYTGYFVLNITTETPLYVRCAYPINVPIGDDGKPEVNKTHECQDFFHHGDSRIPVIPGSTLRGMTRALVEILSFSKVKDVTNRHLVHRGVGDQSSMGDHYRNKMLGRKRRTPNGEMLFEYPVPNLRGGYLEIEAGQHFIRPAQQDEFGETFVHIEYADLERYHHNPRTHEVYEVYVKPMQRTYAWPRSKESLKLNLAYTNRVEDAPQKGLRLANVVTSGHMSAGDVKLKDKDLVHTGSLIEKLRDRKDSISNYVYGELSKPTRDRIDSYRGHRDNQLKQMLMKDLNDLISRESLKDKPCFHTLSATLTLDGQRLMTRRQSQQVQERLNRRLLEASYPDEIEEKDVTEKHMHCAIYDRDDNANRIQIPTEMWKLYEEDCRISRGIETQTRILEESGQPLFYLLKVDERGRVITSEKGEEVLEFFGPTMMFRVPYPNCLFDFIPEQIRNRGELDLAEAIFGTIRQGTTETQAGRVFFTDAKCIDNSDSPFFDGEQGRRVPKILSSPKPTSFQLYLNQPEVGKHFRKNEHDGKTLKTYYDKNETVIRGTKLYWHRKSLATLQQEFKEDSSKVITEDGVKIFRETPNGSVVLNGKQGEFESNPSVQHTIIRPVKKRVMFCGKVYFENLSKLELGALLYALDLPNSKRHKLGMAKPLGLGTIRIQPQLTIEDRVPSKQGNARYDKLFVNQKEWQQGKISADDVKRIAKECIDCFRERIVSHYNSSVKPSSKIPEDAGLEFISRLEALYTMLEWDHAISESKIACLGLEDESQQREWRKRHVLPRPQDLLDLGASVVEPARNSDQSLTGNSQATRDPGYRSPIKSKEVRKPRITEEKEVVTLETEGSGSKLQVRTKDGKTVTGRFQNPQLRVEVGAKYRACVRRESGEPVGVVILSLL